MSDHVQRILNHPSTVRANTTSDDVPTLEIVVPEGGELSATKRIPVQVAAPKLSAAEPNDGAHGGVDQLRALWGWPLIPSDLGRGPGSLVPRALRSECLLVRFGELAVAAGWLPGQLLHGVGHRGGVALPDDLVETND